MYFTIGIVLTNIVSFPLSIYDLLFLVELFVMFYVEKNTHVFAESQGRKTGLCEHYADM